MSDLPPMLDGPSPHAGRRFGERPIWQRQAEQARQEALL